YFPQVSNSSVSMPAEVATWASSDPGVLSVAANGLITAVSGGNATISATVGGAIGTSVAINVPLAYPVITQQPLPLHEYVGATAVFSVAAIGGELSYQWLVGSTPIS